MNYDIPIKIADDLTISSNFTKSDFMKTSLYNNQNLSMFFWIRKNFRIKSHDFYVGFLFENEKISQLQLYCVDKSLENEEERKIFNDEFVKVITSETGLNTGSIKSIENKRDNIALIILNYN